MPALNLTFSPRRRNSNRGFCFFADGRPANPVAGFSMSRRMILLLLGEKAGLRESVATSFPHNIFWTNFFDGRKVKIVKQKTPVKI
ncbi:MAG: hypothetical protein ABSF60_00725 [Verrucomicrobiota bacterium]